MLLNGNIRVHLRDQAGFQILSSLQESINYIGTSSGLTFPHWLSSSSSCKTGRIISLGRDGDPWILSMNHVGVHVKDHAPFTAERQAGKHTTGMF